LAFIAAQEEFMVTAGDIYDLKVEELGFGANGLGRLSSFVIWVEGAIPGDVVRIRVKRRKPKYACAEILEFLERSPYRVKPRSPYCSTCGGCQLIEMEYEKQLYYKSKQLRDILRRIGKVKDFSQKEIVPSPKIFGYRNRMQFSFSKGKNQDIVLGLHFKNSHKKVIDIKSCHLQSGKANKILKRAKEFFYALSGQYAQQTVLPFRHMIIREGKNTGEFLLVLEADEEAEKDAVHLSEMMKASFPEVKSFIFNAMENHQGTTRKRHQRILYGDGKIEEKLGDLKFQIFSEAFFQNNTEQSANLLSIIKQLAIRYPVQNMLDLYCGSGSISISLAHQAKEISGVDHSYSSIRSSSHNAEINNILNCRFLCMDAAEATGKFFHLGHRYDLVTTNPPRAGMPPRVIYNLSQLSPKGIIYISCNPSTLARDCQLLQESGYELREVLPVDMFPHSFHIETIAYLRKNEA
jgi:23S rRNA (uracil1939-C5)-methyltransferase